MEKSKIIDLALILTDAAEGCQSIADSFKLVAASFDDVCNILKSLNDEDSKQIF